MATHRSVKTITRRSMMISSTCLAIAPAVFLSSAQAKPLFIGLDEVEKKSGGRIGWALMDTGTGRRYAHHGTDRFPMCSTFKLLAVAHVLSRVDRGLEQLDRRIAFSHDEVLSYAPVTAAYAGGSGMTVKELCAAAITMSDNTAANVLLKSFGGPEALNEFLRSIGDSITRLDRTEPTLNEATPGDDRDTTTPSLMLENMNRILLGGVLKPPSRALLIDWLIACQTGDARLRAGLPPEWKVGDKTGSGDHGTTNDVAIIWPTGRAPLLLTAYLTASPLSSDERNAVLAQVSKVVARELDAL